MCHLIELWDKLSLRLNACISVCVYSFEYSFLQCLHKTFRLTPDDYKEVHLFLVSLYFLFPHFSENPLLVLLQPSREGNGSVCVARFFFASRHKIVSKEKSWKCLDWVLGSLCARTSIVSLLGSVLVSPSLWLLSRVYCFGLSSHGPEF